MTETVVTANELWAAQLGFNHAGVQWLTRVLNTALQRGNGQYVPTPADLNSIGWRAASMLMPMGQTDSTDHPLHMKAERLLGYTIQHHDDDAWSFLPQF